MLTDLPCFGIYGNSGAGKTTLIEQIVPHLSARGLKVAVVKPGAHGINVDRPGKDSDRFFKSGADVYLWGQQEAFYRLHSPDNCELSDTFLSLCRKYDLVLVEGREDIPISKVWLLSENDSEPPDGIEGIEAVLPRDTDRIGNVMSILDNWLPGQWLKTPVYGCILIGGDSSRMGMSKHLIFENGKTWLESTVDLLEKVVQKVVVAGAGTVPEKLKSIIRLPDIPIVRGPMAGILSAMRWAPYVSWLVVACDLPDLTQEALKWLLSKRKPGVWAAIPMLNKSWRLEPLLAYYDFRSHSLLENLAAQGDYRPAKISYSRNIINPTPPEHLSAAWRNVNTKSERKKDSGNS